MDNKILALGALLGLAVCGGIAFFFMGTEDEVLDPAMKVIELDDFIVNVKSDQYKYVKIKVSFELESAKDYALVVANMAKIKDVFQSYLYGLRLEEMEGSQFVYSLKEELSMRVNRIISPAKIKALLINQILAS